MYQSPCSSDVTGNKVCQTHILHQSLVRVRECQECTWGTQPCLPAAGQVAHRGATLPDEEAVWPREYLEFLTVLQGPDSPPHSQICRHSLGLAHSLPRSSNLRPGQKQLRPCSRPLPKCCTNPSSSTLKSLRLPWFRGWPRLSWTPARLSCSD